MYVYIVYMHVCIYSYTILVYAYIPPWVMLQSFLLLYIAVCVYVCVHVCIYTHVYIRICIHTYIVHLDVCVCVCVCVGHHKTTWQGFSHQVWMYVCLCACVRVCVYRVSQDDVARLFTPSLDRHRYLRHPRSHGRWHGVPRVVVVRGTVYSYMYLLCCCCCVCVCVCVCGRVCLEWWSCKVLYYYIYVLCVSVCITHNILHLIYYI